MALAALVLVAAVLAVTVYLLLNKRRFQLTAKFPQPLLWLPGIGGLADTIYHYGLSGMAWCFGYYKRFGPVWGMWIGPEFFVITAVAEDIEAIVTSPAVIDKGKNYALIWPWLGDGLLLLGAKKWHARRKQLTPTFHFRILEQFMDVFTEKGVVLEGLVDGLVGKGVVDLRPYISRHALDVICETTMGTQLNCQLQEDSGFVQAVKVACKAVDDRHAYPWLRNDALFRMTRIAKEFYGALDIIHGVTKKVIADRKSDLTKEMKEGVLDADNNDEIGTKKRKMFIDHLLTMHLQGEDLSEKDIFDEVNTFMFEGHDTTMTSVCFTLFLLATHPEVQDRVAEEARSVGGTSTSAQLGELKYLEAVIKESLRLYPSVPLYSRHAHDEFKLPSGYTVPAGATLLINAYLMHHREEYFKDPSAFKPERFLSGSSEESSRHHFSYVPFSAGYRNCIGQRFAMLSMKATLARLVSKFRFLPDSADPKLDLDVQVVLVSKSGLPLVVERRD
ncbi:probable cytochrome P450 4s3 isoform X2 [Thrips palmi]|uniref:Probable cytochrome P450 4s3 isoform X2 n=1 Tax=Thrips palmi TaxID=161013 RepID=A0A6P8YMJ4_THRPL|nr:probable cytochrome P450 4s3 isoform X2 [Thrips palmi]